MFKRLLFLICVAFTYCSGFAQTKVASVDLLYKVLSAKKKAVDLYIDKQTKDILVYSKVPGKPIPQKVYNAKWPDETEFDYNVIKSKSGKIIMISQAPTMESGDWYIAYKYYFDETGKTYAFERITNGFNDNVKDSVIYERQVTYFSPAFKSIKSDYSLSRKDGKALPSRMNLDLIRQNYKIYNDVAACLKAFKLPVNL